MMLPWTCWRAKAVWVAIIVSSVALSILHQRVRTACLLTCVVVLFNVKFFHPTCFTMPFYVKFATTKLISASVKITLQYCGITIFCCNLSNSWYQNGSVYLPVNGKLVMYCFHLPCVLLDVCLFSFYLLLSVTQWNVCLAFISHSMSLMELKFVFQYLLADMDLRGKRVLDVGSRLGAVLYGAYVYSSASIIVGAELDGALCNVQQQIIDKYQMQDRIKVGNKCCMM